MKKQQPSHAFISQFFVFMLVAISFSGVAGLSAVWMRHQISLSANANKALEARYAELDRTYAELSTAIAGEESTEVLNQRNQQWHLGLQAPSHVERVTEDPVMRLAAKHNRDPFRDGVAPVVYRPLAVR